MHALASLPIIAAAIIAPAMIARDIRRAAPIIRAIAAQLEL